MSGGLRDASRLSFGLLTALPVRAVTPTRRTTSAAVLLAPLVGLVIGGAAALVVAAARLPLDRGSSATQILPGALAVTTLAVLTRGLHLDGLADTVDGLASMRPPAAARQVMRRGDVGPSAVVTLVLVILLQVVAVGVATIEERATVSILVAVLTGRLVVVLACARGIVAADSTGLGALVAGVVRRREAAVAALLCLWCAGALGALDGDGTRAAEAIRAIAAMLAGVAVAGVVLRHAMRRLGGLTGDVLGALVEISTTVALVAVAL